MDDSYYDIWDNSDDRGYQQPQQPAAPQAPQEQLGSFSVPINSNAPAGTQDLSYWQSRHDQGLPGAPGVEDMFDLNTGQLKPGFVRTARGYEYAPQGGGSATTLPTMDKIPATTGGGGGGLNYAMGGGPSFRFADYQSPGAFRPRNDTFSYQPFAETSLTDLENQPGYKDSQERLRKMTEAGAAYKGILRSGMALGDIWNGLDNNKSQRFAEYDNRRYRNWEGNLSAARNKFLDEEGIDRDVYDRYASDIDRGNNYRFNTTKAQMDDELNRWRTQVESLTSLSRPPG